MNPEQNATMSQSTGHQAALSEHDLNCTEECVGGTDVAPLGDLHLSPAQHTMALINRKWPC